MLMNGGASPDLARMERTPTESGEAWFKAVPARYVPELFDYSFDAFWTVSTAKPGSGIHELLSDDHKRHWQSDGTLPHVISIEFAKKTDIAYLVFYFDFNTFESYIPSRISVHSGCSLMHLNEGHVYHYNAPHGWNCIDLRIGARPLRTFAVQVRIHQNHENGKDSHVTHMRIIGTESFYKASRRMRDKAESWHEEDELLSEFDDPRYQTSDYARAATAELPPSEFELRMQRELTLR